MEQVAEGHARPVHASEQATTASRIVLGMFLAIFTAFAVLAILFVISPENRPAAVTATTLIAFIVYRWSVKTRFRAGFATGGLFILVVALFMQLVPR